MSNHTRTDSIELESDQYAYDVVKQSLVQVADPDVGTVSEQKDAMQDLITRAEGNTLAGYDADTTCVSVVYVEADGDESPKEYTMPATRIIADEAFLTAVQRMTSYAGLRTETFGEPNDSSLTDYHDE